MTRGVRPPGGFAATLAIGVLTPVAAFAQSPQQTPAMTLFWAGWAVAIVVTAVGLAVAVVLVRRLAEARAQRDGFAADVERLAGLAASAPLPLWHMTADGIARVGDVDRLSPAGFAETVVGATDSIDLINGLARAEAPVRETVRTADGRSVDLVAAPLGDGEALLSLVDSTEWAASLSAVEARAAAAEDRADGFDRQLAHTLALTDGTLMPVWLRDGEGRLVAVNAAFARAVGADADQAVADQVELVSGPLRETALALAKTARRWGEPASDSLHAVVAGERRLYRITEVPAAAGAVAYGVATVGGAVDLTEVEEARSELSRHVQAHAEALESVRAAIAVFGPDKRLIFYNQAYLRLWGFEEGWLDTHPTIGELLEQLRENRRLPEFVDFRAYRQSQIELFTSLIAPEEDLMHLPDGTTLRLVTSPHPLGGVMYLMEDVTSALVLERNYNTLMAVQRESLDNLAEAIAVYGGDGRLQLSNPAFERLWRIDAEDLGHQPHIAEIMERTRQFYLFDEEWPAFREAAIARALEREPMRMRLTLADGTILDYRTVPLPDGGVLNSYLDVTDTATVEQALRASNRALETADRLKSEFIANVSYQLRTPLNAIMGFAEILDDRYFGELNDRQRDYTSSIVDASRRLLALINDILDIATIEAGYMELELSRVEIAGIVTSVHDLTREWAAKQNLTLLLDCPDDIGTIDADDRRLKQALYNLVSNAVKFTPTGGTITLSARRVGREVALIVTDTGIGIPSQDQERVFGRFERVQNQGRRGGVGLGLSLVRSLIQLHGGKVILESQPGIGTSVSCLLPVHPITALRRVEPASDGAPTDAAEKGKADDLDGDLSAVEQKGASGAGE